MKRSAWGVAAVALVTTGAGLVISLLVAPPPGAGHHCPGGSPPADCHYPGSQTAWTVWWMIGGLLLGLLVSLTVVGVRSHRRFVNLDD